MATFSEIVDEVVLRTGSSSFSLVAGFVNSALKTVRPIKHHSDLVEHRYMVPRGPYRSNVTFENLFDLPDDFRLMLAVRVDSKISVARKKPGLGQLVSESPYYYYETGHKLFVRGPTKSYVDIAYYKVAKSFLYYSKDKRLVRTARNDHGSTYEFRVPQTDEWIPLNKNNPDHLAAYERHVNWFLDHYADVITIGAVSHAYNATGSVEIGGRMFNLFTNKLDEIKHSLKETNQGAN